MTQNELKAKGLLLGKWAETQNWYEWNAEETEKKLLYRAILHNVGIKNDDAKIVTRYAMEYIAARY